MSYTTLAQSAADWALSKVGCAYSQARRTQEGIFDCSSLVARAYSAQGKRWKYGGSVPTSNKEIYDDDFELLWPATYAQIGKSFGGASVINMARQPGDLQFLCTDSGTSRANKITHVTMVATPTQIVHARGTKYGVCTNSISLYAGKVCGITRYNPACALFCPPPVATIRQLAAKAFVAESSRSKNSSSSGMEQAMSSWRMYSSSLYACAPSRLRMERASVRKAWKVLCCRA